MYILIMNLNEKNLLFEHTKNMHTERKLKFFTIMNTHYFTKFY